MFNPVVPHLWQAACDLFQQLTRWFGMPIDIAQSGPLERREYDVVARFLRGVESMLRTLLFMQAVELCVAGDVPAPKPRAQRVTRAHQKRDNVCFCFRVLTPKPSKRRRSVSNAPQPLWKVTRYYEANPLALRAEAALRVLNDPMPYVRRLARRLKRDASVAARINSNWRKHSNVIEPTRCVEMRYAFEAAAARLPDSS